MSHNLSVRYCHDCRGARSDTSHPTQTLRTYGKHRITPVQLAVEPRRVKERMTLRDNVL